jgi:hypothetical protein
VILRRTTIELALFLGVNIYPDVSLIISRTGELDIGYSGTFRNGNTVEGVWRVTNAPELPMIFVRQ